MANLPGWQQHMSPSDVAEYMLEKGRNVGHEYKTDMDVWCAPTETRVIGLLTLIIKELRAYREQKRESQDPLTGHADWLLYVRPEIEKTYSLYKKQLERISKFCDIDLLGWDGTWELNLEWSRKKFCEGYKKGDWRCIQNWGSGFVRKDTERLVLVIERLKLFKKLEDGKVLEGIGKVKAARIVQTMKERRNG